MQISDYLATRPYLFHLTAESNLAAIQRQGRLMPAGDLLRQAAREDLVRSRRRESVVLKDAGLDAHVRDQQPLHERNMTLSDGWSFGDFVAHLNRHVFFWPGKDVPVPSGMRHFKRYRNESCAIIVVEARRLLDANRAAVPLFCRYNSGSPRWVNGKASPRGPGTFLPAERLPSSPSEVVETVFAGPVVLPEGAWRIEPHGRFLV